MTNHGEVWATIVGFPDYAISDRGRVMRVTSRTNTKMGYILQPSPDKDGYLQVTLCRSGKKCTSRIHRLVASHHIPNPSILPEPNHEDGVKSNNIASNLRWMTRSENEQHAYDANLFVASHGSEHCCAKLTESDVLKIRAMRANGMTYAAIAEVFSVLPQTIHKIASGKSWKHVSGFVPTLAESQVPVAV